MPNPGGNPTPGAKPTPKPVTGPDVSYAHFFEQVLQSLGISSNTPGAQSGVGDLEALADVVNTEGHNTYYNPFNIEWHPGDNTAWEGVANWNDKGVQEYSTEQQGINATAAFLSQNPHWSGVLAALRTNNRQTVEDALTKAYTWAPFHTTSTRQENNILASKIGTSSVNVPGLNLGERIANDISGAVGDITSPLDLAKNVWADVTNVDFWIRVGFIILGLLVLLVALDKLTDGGISGSSGGSATETIDVVASQAGNAAQATGNTAKTAGSKAKSTVKAHTYQPKHSEAKAAKDAERVAEV